MMSRQAYFYRVPPPELHRRNQLQTEPAKTRALQTVIDMKVGQRMDFRWIIFYKTFCCRSSYHCTLFFLFFQQYQVFFLLLSVCFNLAPASPCRLLFIDKHSCHFNSSRTSNTKRLYMHKQLSKHRLFVTYHLHGRHAPSKVHYWPVQSWALIQFVANVTYGSFHSHLSPLKPLLLWKMQLTPHVSVCNRPYTHTHTPFSHTHTFGVHSASACSKRGSFTPKTKLFFPYILQFAY